MVASVLYQLLRVLVEAILTGRRDQVSLQAEVLVLRRQVQVLERQINRVRWSPSDRMILAALLPRLARPAWGGVLVRPETVLGWHRALVRGRWAAYHDRPGRGRPPISHQCRELILRLARENSGWGYFRIRGELLKLGHQASATTIRSVLLRARIPPTGKRSEMTWKQFLAAHAKTVVATDFFTVDTVFFKRLYVLLFVHLGTRQVLAATCTSKPDSSWVTQQLRNLSWQMDEEGMELRFLVHDRDRKFPRSFDEVVTSEGGRVILTPLMAPRANAHAERWIGSCRRECLDRMLILSQRHLEAVLREYSVHYNQERPHRSRELRPPGLPEAPPPRPGNTINGVERLGGLLASYSVAA